MNAASGSSLSIARLVLGWCLWYTRGLDHEVARDRQDELASDVHEQLTSAEAAGAPLRATNLSILARAILGAPADLSWRASRLRGGEVDRPSHAHNRTREAFAFVVFLAGSALVGVGIYLLVRVLRSIDLGLISWLPKAAFPLVALTIVGLLGCGLVIRRSSRGWGSLLLAVSSSWLPTVAVSILFTTSATAGALMYDLAPWRAGAFLASGTLVILFTFSAFWWLVVDRRATALVPRFERTPR